MATLADQQSDSLKYYFEQELRALREDAAEFARDYPAVAQELNLSRGKSADPHVELLMQSFAFLTGRMQYEMDAEQATVPNALLAQLYPHLVAPMPSMTVAQVDVKAEGANFANGWTLARGRSVVAMAKGEGARRVPCRLRSCYHTPLWPLIVHDTGLVPTNHYDFLSDAHQVFSVLRVRVRAAGAGPIQDLPLTSLRFYLHGHELDPYRLYELLTLHLKEVAVLVPGATEAQRLPASSVRWLGFADDEAVLPNSVETPSGFRLLQEYFAFPEKFLFFDVQGIDCRGAADEIDLLFLLDIADKSLRVSPGCLRLNCVPLVNLYSHPLEPLRLDQRQHEYRLLADQTAHAHCEIYHLEEVVALKPGAPPRRVVPYFAMEDYTNVERRDYFYATRRAESQHKSVPGTELYLSLLDNNLNLADPPHETIGGRALCTNRRLAEQLRAGERLQLEGPGPVDALVLLAKTTPHATPALLGATPWALVSQLSLNHLSLTGRPGALDALKSMLRLHAGRADPKRWKQIDSLIALQSEPTVHRMGDDHWRGFCRGVHVRLLFDEERFDGGSLVLFAEVLRRFFALYANVNSFAKVTLESQQRKGEIKSWLPLAGNQIVL